MRNYLNNYGFNLIEVFIAMAVLSIVLLAMAGLIHITVNINRSSAEKTVAMSLAQTKMEQLIAKGYSKLSDTDQSATEDYGAIPNQPLFKRITDIRINRPDTDMMLITVDVYWYQDDQRVRLQTIISDTDSN